MTRAVIFDVDGTIADCSHRLHHLPHWGKFFGDMHLDTVIDPVTFVLRQIYLNNEAKVLIVTARPDDLDYKYKTQRWLADNHIPYHGFYMRKGGDYRQDSIVKKEILQQIISDRYDPFLVIDDQPQVVKMWRDNGLTCLQCAPDEPLRNKYDGQTLFHMMVGPSGAGKSSYVEKYYKPRDVVSTDAIREQLFGSIDAGHNAEDLDRTWNYAHSMIRTRLENGVFTVLDATNIKRKDRLKVLDYVPKNQRVQYVVINRHIDDKLATRGPTRGHRPESLIIKHDQTFRSNLKDILNGDNQDNVVVADKRELK